MRNENYPKILYDALVSNVLWYFMLSQNLSLEKYTCSHKNMANTT